MRKVIICCALFLLNFQFTRVANAVDDISVQTCLDMMGKEPTENELDCYRKIAQKPLVPFRARGLAEEWKPNNDALNVYKQTYALLYSHSSKTNNTPASPNPANRVLTPTPLDNKDLKLQISFKHDLADFHENGSLWFGYTQLSFWQVYDQANSRPFRESNFEPELIYSYRAPDTWKPHFGLSPKIVNVGLVHQSNGQSNPRSRSWHRVYIQTGLEHDYGNDNRLAVLLRLWHRLKENPADDDNPDITNFLGHGDIVVRYTHDKQWIITAIGRPHSIQFDLSLKWPKHFPIFSSFRDHNTNIHVQYFSGYGESLIDYNQHHNTWGLGLSFPFE